MLQYVTGTCIGSKFICQFIIQYVYYTAPDDAELILASLHSVDEALLLKVPRIYFIVLHSVREIANLLFEDLFGQLPQAES